MNPNAIREAIANHLTRTVITDRGDEQYAHVSDTFGCDYATWVRRNGDAPPHDRSPESCLKMALGNDVERYVLDALQDAYEAEGWTVARNARIQWNPATGVTRSLPEEAEPLAGTIVGHYDFFAVNGEESHLLEIKSTSFLKGRAPNEPSLHYVEQAATYATALAATHAGIIIACRESGRIAGPFWLDLDALEFATIERAKAVLEKTNSLIPPQAEPRYAWQCKYCPIVACAKNPRHQPDPAQQLEASL